MGEIAKKQYGRASRAARVRSTIHGTKDRPRLSVFISNQHVSAQVIDDDNGKTLASATTVGMKTTGTMTEKATKIGEEVAQAAKTAKIKRVTFDRGNRKYHGRLKALADAARAGGLEF